MSWACQECLRQGSITTFERHQNEWTYKNQVNVHRLSPEATFSPRHNIGAILVHLYGRFVQSKPVKAYSARASAGRIVDGNRRRTRRESRGTVVIVKDPLIIDPYFARSCMTGRESLGCITRILPLEHASKLVNRYRFRIRVRLTAVGHNRIHNGLCGLVGRVGDSLGKGNCILVHI